MFRPLLKPLLVVTFITTSFAGVAHDLQQPLKANNAITDPIYQLFNGMREHNQPKILAQFTDKAQLQRITKDAKIVNTDVSSFAASVSKNTAKLDEHLLAVTVHEQDELASVWTPFAFYLNDKLSHCGSNSFQLVKLNGEWKIHYLIDIAYKGDCQAFVEKYKQ